MPWKPGESGNPGGRRREKLLTDALILELKSLLPADPESRSKARALAEVVVARALGGDMEAVRFIGDRVEGKPTQPIEAESVQRILFSFPAALPPDADDGVEE